MTSLALWQFFIPILAVVLLAVGVYRTHRWTYLTVREHQAFVAVVNRELDQIHERLLAVEPSEGAKKCG